MKKIVCVKWGKLYSYHDVNILNNMIKKNTTKKYKLYCLTEDLFGIDEEIGIIPLPKNNTYEGYWNKMHLFDKDVIGIDDFLYFDLDMVIQNNIDNLLEFKSDNLCLIKATWKDPNVWKQYNSSAMLINTNRDRYVHDLFVSDYNLNMCKNIGDEDFIVKNFEDKIETFPEWFYSRVYGNSKSGGRYYYPEKMICLLNGMINFYPEEYYKLYNQLYK